MAKQLCISARDGKLQSVQDLLLKGIDVDSIDDTKTSALQYASLQGHNDIVNFLLKFKPNLNYQNNIGFTALHYASMKGHFEVVKNLFEAGASIFLKDTHGNTPFLRSGLENHLDIMKYLFENGANLNDTDNSDCSSLLHACSFGCSDIVTWLVSEGADVNFHPKGGMTAAVRAASSGNLKILQLLLENGALAMYQHGDSAAAAEILSRPQVQELINQFHQVPIESKQPAVQKKKRRRDEESLVSQSQDEDRQSKKSRRLSIPISNPPLKEEDEETFNLNDFNSALGTLVNCGVVIKQLIQERSELRQRCDGLQKELALSLQVEAKDSEIDNIKLTKELKAELMSVRNHLNSLINENGRLSRELQNAKKTITSSEEECRRLRNQVRIVQEAFQLNRSEDAHMDGAAAALDLV